MLNDTLKMERLVKSGPFEWEAPERTGYDTANSLPDGGKRILAKRGREYIVFRLEDIAYFYVENGVSYMVDLKTRYKYIAAKALRDIEATLRSGCFFRVNKKYLISINAVVKFRPGKKGKLELTLAPDPSESITISQVKAKAFKDWILLA